MKTSIRVAIARIVSDLIKADCIVDTAEMECWRDICKRYSIYDEERAKATDMSLAEAVDTVCQTSDCDLNKKILEMCRMIALIDGLCSQSEGLLMIALCAVFDPESELNGEIISFPRANFDIQNATTLYIESYNDPETNQAIRTHYRTIYKELQSAGFHFVYIPEIIERYKSTNTELFKKILSFLAPSMSTEGVENSRKSLLNMTTETFCKDLLCNKCGLDGLRNITPSLLIKIGNSYVGDTLYANYLRIPADESIPHTVRTLVDRFTELIGNEKLLVDNFINQSNKFYFDGFNKQLIDIFLVRRNIRSSVLINPYKEEIAFPEIDTKASGLHRRERALYTLLLCQGRFGINFNTPKTGAELERYKQRMHKIQRRYVEIYKLFGGNQDAAPDLSIAEIRRPMFSCLKRSLRNLRALYNPDDYNITKSDDGSFSVNIEPELVYVRQSDSDKPVPLLKSDLYRKWAEL